MRRYFSTVLTSGGCCCAYSSIYKKDPTAKVFTIYDGDDFERAVFFERLKKNLSGYSITAFNPFFDESTDGLYIENINTYILSEGGFNHISPTLYGIWEKNFSIATEKNYPVALRREIMIHKDKEKKCYKQAVRFLQKSAFIKDRIHKELSPHLMEAKLSAYIRRFCKKHFNLADNSESGTVRLLSASTPLGIHTHYDTIFKDYEKIIDISDASNFVSSIILGVIKDFAIEKKMEFIMSPSYFARDIPQFLLFPKEKLAITVSDENHILPFSATENVKAKEFLSFSGNKVEKTVSSLISAENSFLEKCVLRIYEGREERFHGNSIIGDFTDMGTATQRADLLVERLVN